MIFLSEAAIARIQRFISQRPQAIGVHVAVTRGGCSGYSYSLDLVENVGEDQQRFDYDGFAVVVDRVDLTLVEGLRLDVKKQGLNESFAFDNPQAQETCGCGSSFSVN